MIVRNEIEKKILIPTEINDCISLLEDYEEYMCIVIGVDDEIEIPYYDECVIQLKYHKELGFFIDKNGNKWCAEEVLYIYMPLNVSVEFIDFINESKETILDWIVDFRDQATRNPSKSITKNLLADKYESILKELSFIFKHYIK